MSFWFLIMLLLFTAAQLGNINKKVLNHKNKNNSITKMVIEDKNL
jgi:hypothetical protein